MLKIKITTQYKYTMNYKSYFNNRMDNKWVFVYMRPVASTKSDILVDLVDCYLFYWGGSDGDNLTAEGFCGKNLLTVLFFCIEKRLTVSHKTDWKYVLWDVVSVPQPSPQWLICILFTVHAQNGHIYTSSLISDVTIVFLDPNLLDLNFL